MKEVAKLYYQRQSPYCRKTIVAADELGILKAVEMIEQATSPLITQSDLCAINPLGKVPVLVHESQQVFDSVQICKYLDDLCTNVSLYGDTEQQRSKIKNFETLADGICDAGILVKQERERELPQSSQSLFERGQLKKIANVLRYFEIEPAFYTDPLHIGHIALATGLLWLEFAKIPHQLESLPNLRAWYQSFIDRPSIQGTPYLGETDDGFTIARLTKQARQIAF